MILTEFKLPQGYSRIPLKEICSNKLINCEGLATINNVPPFLIGTGIVPKIWLKLVASEYKLIDAVVNNISSNNRVVITEDKFNRTTIVAIGPQIIVHSQMIDDSNCKVRLIDLRPFGINLFGTENELFVGGSKFSRNTFSGSLYAIGLG